MLNTFKSAWKIEDLRKKIIYTLLMLFVYRLGSFIPVPGIDSSYMQELVSTNTLLGLLDIISGGAFANFTVFAMGITPYINSSIIMNLLTVAIPRLEQLAKEGEEGRKKIAQFPVSDCYTCLCAGNWYYLWPCPECIENRTFIGYIVVALTLTAGTAFLMWLGNRLPIRE